MSVRLEYKKLPEFRVRQITLNGQWFVQRLNDRSWKTVSTHTTKSLAETRKRLELHIAMKERHND